MKTQQVQFLIPPYLSASLTLPAMLGPEAFARLGEAISQALGEPGPPSEDPIAADPGAAECDSWCEPPAEMRRAA